MARTNGERKFMTSFTEFSTIEHTTFDAATKLGGETPQPLDLRPRSGPYPPGDVIAKPQLLEATIRLRPEPVARARPASTRLQLCSAQQMNNLDVL